MTARPAPRRLPYALLATHSALAADLLRWVLRRGPHGVGDGDVPVAYAPAQSATMYGLFGAAVVETTALALLIPWPLAHALTLAVDLWGCFLVLALHASCVVRPHVVGADGSLRLRHGALLDVRLSAAAVAAVRADRRYPDGGLAVPAADGTADLAVGGTTTVRVELTGPLPYARPLGRAAEARAFRFHAEDAAAAVAALRAAAPRTGPARDGTDDGAERIHTEP
ncbi:hypothetical protein [Streptomyces sp. Z26]|uniref:hypothetical protein n=1 Tax=Streptomyces sp. Z26 TaxID=2500177 RepID=UPI001F0BEA24|nr:hypothetical protein [Streptomyces sp. Z26]